MSALLHVVLIGLLLIWPEGRRLPQPGPSTEVPVEFEDTAGEVPPGPSRQTGSVPGPPLPEAAAPVPAPARPPAPPSRLLPPIPVTPPVQLPAPPVAPAPPTALPELPPPLPLVPDGALPPPPAPPAAVVEAQPPLPPETPAQPRAPATAAARPIPRSSPFAGALDLSRGPPITFAQPPSARPAPRRGTMDLALGVVPEARAPAPSGSGNQNGSARVVGGVDPGRDWLRLLLEWVEANAHYPREAARNNEDGPNTVRLVITSDGTVQSVQLRSPSGSVLLDAATQGVFRGRKVPAFLPGTPEGSTTLDFTIHYVLIRG